jgi:pimeloyl-ACP methyl ester carboxylesterase
VPVLLLHGLGGDHHDAVDLLGPALPEGSAVIAPDARAHGASTLVGDADDFRLESLAAEIAADLPHEPLSIVGISMGAAIALRLALRGDVEVQRLVLVRPAFTDEPLPPNLALFPVIGDLLQTFGPEHGERLFRETDLYEELRAITPIGAQAALDQFSRPDAAARAIRLVEVPRNRAWSSTAELARLAVPTSVVAAPRDPVHPVDVAELWARSLPGASLSLVPARDENMAGYVAGTRAAVRAAFA